MAKKIEQTEGETLENQTTEGQEGNTEKKESKPKVINLVAMADGSQKNFGGRGKLLSTETVNENDFSVVFHIANGEQAVYNFKGDTKLLLAMAAFGASTKIKSACSGLKTEEIKAIVEAKIKEFDDGDFIGRTTGDLTQVLSQIQLAWAIVNGIDASTSEGVAKVNAIFSAMSKEDKGNLYKLPKIQLELAKLKLAAAEAAILAENTENTETV
jgi:hypothetical protein